MIVATWNVLHRVHAVNWDEPAIAAHADEDGRVAAIARRVGELGADVVCLQEVSGDLLAALGEVIAMQYPRVPHYYRARPQPVPRQRSEHLVVIARDGKKLHGEAFASDRGKGFLVVELGGVMVVNTHVTYGDKHAAQCARIVEYLGDRAPVVVVGDFNADRETSLRHLGGGFEAAVLAEATRPRTQPGGKSETIDQVLVRGLAIEDSRVESAHGLSDHNPVVALVANR